MSDKPRIVRTSNYRDLVPLEGVNVHALKNGKSRLEAFTYVRVSDGMVRFAIYDLIKEKWVFDTDHDTQLISFINKYNPSSK